MPFRVSTLTPAFLLPDMPETLPNITVPELLEVGTEAVVVCTLDGLFPVSEAEIYLELGHTRLEPTVTYNKHSISAKAEVPVAKEGVQQLECTVLLGTEMRQQEKSLTFYSKYGGAWPGLGCN